MKLVAAAKLRRAQERILAARPVRDARWRELLGEPGRTRRRATAPSAPRAARTGRKRLVDHHRRQGAVRRLQLQHPPRVAARSCASRATPRSRWSWWARRPATSTAAGQWHDQVARCSASATGWPTPTRRSWPTTHAVVPRGEVDEVHLMYNEFRSVAVQRPVREQLLPIQRARRERRRRGAAGRVHLRAEPRGHPRRRCCRAT